MNQPSNIQKFKLLLPSLINILKYSFSIILTFWAYFRIHNKHYLVAALLELCIIFVLSNLLLCRKHLGQIINNILLFLYNAQMAILGFGNTYLSMLMLTNIASIKALSGKAVIYITAAVTVLIFSLLPIKNFIFLKNSIHIYFHFLYV